MALSGGLRGRVRRPGFLRSSTVRVQRKFDVA